MRLCAILALSTGFLAFSLAAAEPAPQATPLTLEECLNRVSEQNERLQVRALEWLSSRRRADGARWIWEPDFVGGASHELNNRKNTVERSISLGVAEYDEKNNLYNGALEMLVPTGGKLRAGYSLRDLDNNLQGRFGPKIKEYESFAGLSLTQPLLRNGGYAVTMAGIRLAAGESEIAFQEYRRQMSQIIALSEAAYWDLFLAREQLQIRTDSVRVADTLLKDNKLRLQTGKSSELEVLQAEAGVALRRARLKEAQQKLVEGNNKLNSLISGSASSVPVLWSVTDKPRDTAPHLDFISAMQEVIENNPDYLSQRRQTVQEAIRVVYAANQRWPQLDLKASYGANGLGTTPGTSWDDLTGGQYPNWSIGAEFRIPIGGNVRGRRELEAARLKQEAALVSLKAIEVEIASAVDTALHRISSLRDSVASYSQVVDFNRKLLETELTRLDVGRTDSRKVLETEDSLSEARSAALDATINFQKSLIEWDLARGTILKARKLELNQDQLEFKTTRFAGDARISPARLRAVRHEAAREFKNNDAKPLTPAEQQKLLDFLHGTPAQEKKP